MCRLRRACPSALHPLPRLGSCSAPQVLLPVSVEADVPEWLFQRTGQELKAAFLAATRRRQSEQVLMTRATRERLQRGAPLPPPRWATIKVKFPEGLALQASAAAVRGGPIST